MDNLITFTNPAVLDWLKAKGITGEYKQFVTTSEVLRKHVYGHLPYWLAAYADRVSEVSLPRLSKADRMRFNQGNLSVAEMDAAGAYISTYEVRQS